MKLKSLLGQIYEQFGHEWVKQNGFVFDTARKCELTLAGSIGLAVARKKAIRPPGDIDFVCASNEEAMHFINKLQGFLLKRSVYWRILVNSRTAFCPKGCTAHFRFVSPFWLPICVMVIGEVRHWRVSGGNLIQNFDDVVQAAKDLDERDGKGRLDEEPKEDPDPRQVSRPPVDLSEVDPHAAVLSDFDHPSFDYRTK